MLRAKWAPLVSLLAATFPLPANTLAEAEALLRDERLAEAEVLLTRIASKSPTDLQVRFRLAYVEFRLRKLTRAAQLFESLVRDAPPALDSRYFLGRIALLDNRAADAIRWLEPLVRASDTTYDAASQLALAFVKAGQPQAAVQPLRDAIQREPWDGALYYRLGRLHQDLGQPELAREALGVAARLKAAGRENVESLMNASMNIRAGKSAEALDQLRTVVSRPDAEPNILLAAGVLYSDLQQPAQALAAFERAAHMADNQYATQFNYGLALLRSGRTVEALPVVERAVSLLPQSFEAQLTFGLANVMARKYDTAIEPLTKAHGMEPGHARVASLLATALLRTGQPEKAIPLLQSLSAAPDPAPTLLYIEALQQAGRDDEALAAAREARARYPDHLATAMTLGQILTKAGRYAEAKPVFAAVVSSSNAPPEAILGLADALQKSGEHEQAIDRYRQVLSAPAVRLQARLGLARSLVARRQLDEARRVLEDGKIDHAKEPALFIDLARVYSRLQQPALAAEATSRVEALRLQQSNPAAR